VVYEGRWGKLRVEVTWMSKQVIHRGAWRLGKAERLREGM
jgi:hypothetical protein